LSVLLQFFDVLRHLDQHVEAWSQQLGGWLYLALFAIIFAETGLVVTPFLPGDSLLFTVGAVCALPESAIQLIPTAALLIAAAVLGDAVNYSIGRSLGPKVFTAESSRILNKKHLLRTQEFYERYGGKTIIIARFVPIVRTFAPFLAGVAAMAYPRFLAYNVAGGVMWIALLVYTGYFFGNIPWVKDNLALIVVAIVVVSLIPAVVAFLRERGKR